jgi:ribosomal protein S18 acetylase RimI-like enzyme
VLQWALGGKGLDHGTAWLTADGAGAALWLPPNAEPDFAPVGPMMEQTVTPEHMAGVGALMAQVQAAHPAFPHWYLAVLGVDPHRQSEGLGAQLMKAALARVDAEGLPAYLESSNQRNVPFYERHGFEVIGRIQAGSSPVITPMLRPAR